MSLLNIVSHIEQERDFNRALMNSLIADLDADIRRLTEDFDANIQRITERKASIIEEFEERDAGFARLIDGDAPKAAPLPAPEQPDSGEELAA